MSGLNSIGRWLMLIGLGIALIGLIAWGASRVPFLNRLGNLPGDIHITRGPVSCFVPLASSIILSIILTVVLNLVIRLLNR